MKRLLSLVLVALSASADTEMTAVGVTVAEMTAATRVRRTEGIQAIDENGKIQTVEERIGLLPRLPGGVNTTTFDLITSTRAYEDSLTWVFTSRDPPADPARYVPLPTWLEQEAKNLTLPSADVLAARTKEIYDHWVESSQLFRKSYLKEMSQTLDQKGASKVTGGLDVLHRYKTDFVKKTVGDEGPSYFDFGGALKADSAVLVESGWAPVISDLTLVIPVGLRKIKRTFNVLESVVWSDAVPKRIMLMSGAPEESLSALEADTAETVAAMNATYLLLKDYYSKSFNMSEVEISWAIFKPLGGAAIGRWLGTHNTDTEFVAYFDNDDFLLPWSLPYRASVLRKRPDLDILLTAYTGLVNDTVEPASQVDFMDRVSATWTEAINQHNITELDEQISTLDVKNMRKDYEEAYFVNSTTSFMLGAISGWPQLTYVTDIQELATKAAELRFERGLVNEVPQDPFEVPVAWCTSADPLLVLHERADIRYLRYAGTVQPELYPQYYQYCHNGWLMGRRIALDLLPPTASHYGEDALTNYIAFSAGFNVYCQHGVSGGVYTHISDNLNARYLGLAH